jgi:hypothetical protein
MAAASSLGIDVLALDFECLGDGSSYDLAALGMCYMNEELEIMDRTLIPLWVEGQSVAEERCFTEFWDKVDENGNRPMRRALETHFRSAAKTLKEAYATGYKHYASFRSLCESRSRERGKTLILVFDCPVYDAPKLQQLVDRGGQGENQGIGFEISPPHKWCWKASSDDYRAGLADHIRGTRQVPPLVKSDRAVLQWAYHIPLGPRDKDGVILHDHMPQNDAANHAFDYIISRRINAGLHKSTQT